MDRAFDVTCCSTFLRRRKQSQIVAEIWLKASSDLQELLNRNSQLSSIHFKTLQTLQSNEC